MPALDEIGRAARGVNYNKFVESSTSRISSSLSWVGTRLATLARAPVLDLRSCRVGGPDDGALLLVVSAGADVGDGSHVVAREASPPFSAICAVTRGGALVSFDKVKSVGTAAGPQAPEI